MALTEAQREKRRKYVGASDVAAIMGVDPWRSAADVWNEKVYGVVDETSEAAELGNYMEGACRGLAAKALGLDVLASNPFRVVDGSPIGVNLDAHVTRGDLIIPVECKTAGMLNPFGAQDQWGDSWSDQVPERYVLQVHAQMLAVKAETSYISAIIAGRGHDMFEIPFDREIGDMILEQAAAFWAKVQSREPVSDEVASLDILKRLRREPGSTTRFEGEAAAQIVRWRQADRAAKDAEAEADLQKRRVIDLLSGGAESELGFEGADIVYNPDDIPSLAVALDKDEEKAAEQCRLTYLEQSRKGVDMDLLRANFPEALAACSKVSTFRVLRLGKAPKAKKGAK